MSEAKISVLKGDIDELNELLKQAKRKRVQDLLTLEVRKLETEWINLRDSASSSSATPMEVTPLPTTSAPVKEKRYQVKLNGYEPSSDLGGMDWSDQDGITLFGWDQSDKYVKIFVTLKNAHNLPKEQVYCKLTEKSMELVVENLDNKDYTLLINKLLEPINVGESHWKQKTDMVVIFLAKQHPNNKWSHMTEIEKKFEDQRNNRFKNDDFDKKDPQESIMSLMKNMYETGDDEMKRMISKAWYEGQQKKKTDIVDL